MRLNPEALTFVDLTVLMVAWLQEHPLQSLADDLPVERRLRDDLTALTGFAPERGD